jgi:uncharacterized protein (TIGR00369 family)
VPDCAEGGGSGPATGPEDAPPGAGAGPEHRTRTYAYDARPLDLAVLRELGGREVIELMRAGRVPGSPMWRTADCRIAEVEDGHVVFEAAAHPFALNFAGGAHGGWIATLLDNAMGLAIMSRLPAGRTHTTTELSVRYVRALLPTVGTVRIEGRAIHVGRRLATAEGRVADALGRLYAHAATSCMILEA